MKQTYVVVAVYDDGYGSMASAICDGMATANQWLRNYVKRWWQREIGEPVPEPITDAHIERYFRDVLEWYSISEPLPIVTLEMVNGNR